MFQTILIQPIYNGFIYLIGIMPGGNVGLAIIAMTLIIRAVFYPAFAASIRTQMGMQAIQGEIDEINKKYKDDANERGKRTMELLKENKVRPFSTLLAFAIQIPVFFALYYAFFREGLPKIATNLLYPGVHAPLAVNVEFFGILNLLSVHNVILAAVVGGLQYLVIWFSIARTKKAGSKKETSSDKEVAQRTQQQLMLYFFPAMMLVIAYSLPAAVGIYFATTNLVSLGQEWLIRRQMGIHN